MLRLHLAVFCGLFLLDGCNQDGRSSSMSTSICTDLCIERLSEINPENCRWNDCLFWVQHYVWCCLQVCIVCCWSNSLSVLEMLSTFGNWVDRDMTYAVSTSDIPCLFRVTFCICKRWFLISIVQCGDVYVACQHEDNVLVLQIVNLWIDLSGMLQTCIVQFSQIGIVRPGPTCFAFWPFCQSPLCCPTHWIFGLTWAVSLMLHQLDFH